MPERAQLDISEPYKVYRLVPLSEQGEEQQPGWLCAADTCWLNVEPQSGLGARAEVDPGTRFLKVHECLGGDSLISSGLL